MPSEFGGGIGCLSLHLLLCELLADLLSSFLLLLIRIHTLKGLGSTPGLADLEKGARHALYGESDGSWSNGLFLTFHWCS